MNSLGFIHHNNDTVGSHEKWRGVINGKKQIVTVDKKYKDFDGTIIKSMINQSGVTREEFYCATRQTAKKINMKPTK